MPHLRALRRFGAATPIPLGRRLLAGSTYPVTFAFAETKAARTGRPITPPYLALLRAGFAATDVTAGAVRSYRTFSPCFVAPEDAPVSGVFSVPLSVKSPCPGVTRHCPSGSDFPPIAP